MGFNAKKQKQSDTLTPKMSGTMDAIENLTYSITKYVNSTRANDRLRDLHELLCSDENSLMLHQTEMINLSDQFAIILDDVDQGKVTQDSIRFVARKNAYDACNDQIQILQSRIKQSNHDIKTFHMEMENVFVTPKKNYK